MEFQAVWDFTDDDPVGGGVAATFSMYLHRRSVHVCRRKLFFRVLPLRRSGSQRFDEGC
ncbi:hypothetical protein RHGRI_004864 [Rhododendron griersonianum]|uniref:Uncharacterized protein n=1 Tax=Rhododendron griersonianum TaxID=479676 RepID=A0AAV6LAK0_9ERIC|nr:hypothetical protein RHGRI_004862 [Rhododendron griersonianum]KAG5561968.1 hypothetical protein RHGRI_004864 [Rhododendron griersonianum]